MGFQYLSGTTTGMRAMVSGTEAGVEAGAGVYVQQGVSFSSVYMRPWGRGLGKELDEEWPCLQGDGVGFLG